MAQIQMTNFGDTTIASGISAGDTTITLAAGTGSRFPALSAGDWFYAVLVDTSANREIVKVTARSTDALTATRAQEGTTARAFAVGSVLSLRLTVKAFQDYVGAVALTSAGAATLSNKTLDATNIFPAAIAQLGVAQERTAVETIRPTSDSSASYTWAVNTDPNLVLTTTGNLTLNAPTGLTIGAFYFLEIVYGGTHTVTWNANFKGVAGLTLTSTAAARDAFMFRAQTTSILELVGTRLNVGA